MNTVISLIFLQFSANKLTNNRLGPKSVGLEASSGISWICHCLKSNIWSVASIATSTHTVLLHSEFQVYELYKLYEFHCSVAAVMLIISGYDQHPKCPIRE